MASLGHGGNAKEISRNMGISYDKIIDFSANINPLGMSADVKKAIIDNLDLVEKYPDITYFELKNVIKNFENLKIEEDELKINNDEIILGNGASEVLFNVVRAINPKRVLIPAPTFSEYEEAVKAIGGKIDLYYLLEENDFKINDDILNYINDELDAIFICNPNNPTGVITNKDILKRILDKSLKTNTYVIIDESFLDFVDIESYTDSNNKIKNAKTNENKDYSMIRYLKSYPNLIIIKSLTKFFALPGIRIGYALADNKELIEDIKRITPAWNINILAETAVKAALNDYEYMLKTVRFMEKERDYLYNELKQINNIKVFKPSVNFIFFKINNVLDADIKNELIKRKILIRSCSNYHGLNQSYYRIAVKKHKENMLLIDELRNLKILNL